MPALSRCVNEGGKTGARQNLGAARHQTSTLLSNVRHVTLAVGPLWNGNGKADENFHNLPVCLCGITRVANKSLA